MVVRLALVRGAYPSEHRGEDPGKLNERTYLLLTIYVNAVYTELSVACTLFGKGQRRIMVWLTLIQAHTEMITINVMNFAL